MPPLLTRYFVATERENGGDDTAVTLTTTVILLLTIVTLNFVGVFKVWYWRVWWFDIPMHLAGGAWSALLFFYFFEERLGVLRAAYRSNQSRIRAIMVTFLLAASAVALLGVLWELFEYLLDIFITQPRGWPQAQQNLGDTMADLFNDLLGGMALGAVYWKRKLRRKVENPDSVS